MTALFTLPKQIPIDSSGTPYGGAKLYFYRAGTTTDQNVYTTSALSVAHAQPVVADADGVFPSIYLNHAADYDYRVQLYTSSDALIYDQDNYPKNGVTGVTVLSTAIKYDRTAAESAAGVTPVNYAKWPSPWKDISRFVSDNTGVTDETTNFRNAMLAEKSVVVPPGTYRLTGPLRYRSNLRFLGAGADTILLVDHTGSAFENNSGAAVLFAHVGEFTIRTNRTNLSTALPLIDVSRSIFHDIIIDRESSGQSFGNGVRLWNSSSVSLWNKLYNIHATCITGTALYFDNGVNGNKVYGFNLVNQSDLDCQRGIYFGGGSTNYVHGAELEAVFDGGGSPVNVIDFAAATTQCGVFGVRCEGYPGTADAYAVRWNGSAGNIVNGLLATGLTGTLRDSTGKNYFLAMDTSGNGTQYLGGNGLEMAGISLTPAEGAFTVTLTGVTTTATGTARYTKIGNKVTLYLPSITATSNTTTATLTGAPSTIFPARTQRVVGFLLQDNGVTNIGTGNIDTSGVITLGFGPTEAAFTPAGTKGLFSSTITYSLA